MLSMWMEQHPYLFVLTGCVLAGLLIWCIVRLIAEVRAAEEPYRPLSIDSKFDNPAWGLRAQSVLRLKGMDVDDTCADETRVPNDLQYPSGDSHG